MNIFLKVKIIYYLLKLNYHKIYENINVIILKEQVQFIIIIFVFSKNIFIL